MSMIDIVMAKEFLRKVGLSREATQIYLALIEHGRQTVTDISRNSRVERTKVYRTLPELEETGLVSWVEGVSRTELTAASFDTVQVLLSKKEQEVEDLKRMRAGVASVLRELESSAPRTSVKVYRGSEAIKQMLWNETKSKTELLSILRHGIQIDTREKFFDRWVRVCNERGLIARSIVGPDFSKKQEQWHHHRSVERLRHWRGRVVEPETFQIEHDMIIYDDTVGYYYWGQDEVFGVEINNSLVSSSQRQFFELLWRMGVEA